MIIFGRNIAVSGVSGLRSLLVLGLQTLIIISLSAQQKPSRQSALEAFNKGDYEKALNDFSSLLITFPKDPLYKYYTGVSLINLNRDPERALTLLSEAQQGNIVVRSLPADARFWLGRAQQMTGLFSEAIGSFNSYTEQYGRRAARELGIPQYIQQCSEGKGKIIVDEPSPLSVKEVPVLKPAEDRSSPVSADIDRLLGEALEYQSAADSLYRLSEDLKGDIANADSRTRNDMNARITEVEKLAASSQQAADRKYGEAQAAMNSTSFSSPERPVVEVISQPTPPSLPENVQTIPDDEIPDEVINENAQDHTSVQASPVYSLFEKRPLLPGKTEAIPVNDAIPPGLIYRIQIAVFRNPVDPSYFKGIWPVHGFREKADEPTVYYAGMFRRIADARNPLTTVRQAGFRDAFIVALADGGRISLERAAVMEKEWGKKPFVTAASDTRQATADTLPPELCFRVEVMRSPKPVKDDILETMTRISGTRGLDIEQGEKNSMIYLIGKFITYESAVSYADLLVRNGYRDAKVVARLGTREVPVETARELFEKVR
jgi:tetratricopeptide (TPR) repeat protein